MHARVVTAQMKAGTLEEAARIYQDSVAPAAAQTQGNDGVILLIDPNSSAVISISLWDTEDNMAAGELSGCLLDQLQKFGGLFGDAPASKRFEVSFISVRKQY